MKFADRSSEDRQHSRRTTPSESMRSTSGNTARTRVINIHTGERYDVYCGRPSKWGNPYPIRPGRSRVESLRLYRGYLSQRPQLVESARRTLRGKVLGCFCKPKDCHCDILIEFMEA